MSAVNWRPGAASAAAEPVRVTGRRGDLVPGRPQPVAARPAAASRAGVADRGDPRGEHLLGVRADRQGRVPGEQPPVDQPVQQQVAVARAAHAARSAGVGDQLDGGRSAVAGGQQRGLHRGQCQRRVQRPTQPAVLDGEVRRQHRRPPAAHREVGRRAGRRTRPAPTPRTGPTVAGSGPGRAAAWRSPAAPGRRSPSRPGRRSRPSRSCRSTAASTCSRARLPLAAAHVARRRRCRPGPGRPRPPARPGSAR